MKKSPYINLMIYSMIGLCILFGCVYPIHIGLSSFDTDFLDYCTSILSYTEPTIDHPFKRSKIAGFIPYILSIPFGILNGLALSSIFFTGLILIALMMVVQHIHNEVKHLAWIIVIITCNLFGPVGSLTRSLNYYPQIIASLFISSIVIGLTIQRTTSQRVLAASLCIILCLCIDPRGILWGMFYSMLLLVTILFRPHRIRHVLLFFSVLLLGWWLGSLVYNSDTMSLSRQLDVRPLYYHLDPRNPLYALPHLQQKGFVWGIGNYNDLIYEIRFIYEQLHLQPPKKFFRLVENHQDIHVYWTLCIILLIFSTFTHLYSKKHRKVFFCFFASSLPFLLVFYKTPTLVEPHIRFFSQGLVGILPFYCSSIIILKEVLSKTNFTLLMLILGSTVLYFEPKWSISRVMLMAELNSSDIDGSDVYQTWSKQFGSQVHLMVLPLNQRESELMSSWPRYCQQRLHQDNVLAPFYTIFPLEKNNEKNTHH